MALAWWIITIIVFILAYLFVFKFQDFMFLITLLKKNIFLILALGIVLFFAFSLYHIHTNYDINWKSFDGIRYAGKLYWVWMKNVFANVGSITGYAVQQDWFLNSTNVTK